MRIYRVAIAFALPLLFAGVAQAQQASDNNGRDNPSRQDQSPQREDASRRDDPQQRNDAARQENPPPQQPGGVTPLPARADPNENAPDAAYMAEVRKCNRMSGELRTQCVTNAKQKYGQM
ncbi:MAG TPA: hypothetical protein VHB46_02125 [Burkholderiales bacterium]|nr:hypothetical protein [Burkholderiales bacterium]